MPDAASLSSLDAVLSYAFLGLLVGVGYYMAYRMNVGFEPPANVRWLFTVVSVLRIVAAIGFFAWLASLGSALPPLSAFAGFLVGRVLAFRLLGGDD
jgi:cytosine/uracil/thiamine/allantoin permease